LDLFDCGDPGLTNSWRDVFYAATAGRFRLRIDRERDSLAFHATAPSREWLWMQTQEQGMTGKELQVALQELANWGSQTETSVPTGEFWKG
jgi:hypothetical protein